MRARPWRIGICGTFDVANYGDLLFPLIAESELTARLGAVILHRFSYGARVPPRWPYEVTSISALAEMIRDLDGLLVGGGFLIRFDKQVAPGYAPPSPAIHHPTGYWLTPALLALQHDVPLVWNAPGMHCNDIPEWAHPLLKMAVSLSRYVAVRDTPSREALQNLSGTPVAVVPDTAFRITRLLSLRNAPSAEVARLAKGAGLDGPYIVVQATLGIERFVRFVKRHAMQFRGLRILALPMSPVLGENVSIVDADLPGLVRLSEWPTPLVIAELIARSEGVVGHSYHLIITALAAGVPVFATQNVTAGKYTALRGFATLVPLPSDDELDADWFLSRLGRSDSSQTVGAADAPLDEHWDRIAAAIQSEDAPNTSVAINGFWQTLPSLLENAHLRLEQSQKEATLQREQLLADTTRQLDECARAATLRHDEASAALRNEQAKGRVRLQRMTLALTAVRAEIRETRRRLEDSLQLLETAHRKCAQTRSGLDNALRDLDIVGSAAADIERLLDESQQRLIAASRKDAVREQDLEDLTRLLTTARVDTAARDRRIAEIMASTSWRLTTPVRFVGHRLRKRGRDA